MVDAHPSLSPPSLSPPQTQTLALIAEFVKTPPQGYDEEATANNTATVK